MHRLYITYTLISNIASDCLCNSKIVKSHMLLNKKKQFKQTSKTNYNPFYKGGKFEYCYLV